MAEVTCSVVEGGKPCPGRARSRGWCKKHYDRWLRHGDPLVVAGRGQGVFLAELRAAGEATTDECIILTRRGTHRPVAKLNGTLMLASRAVWILKHGHPGEQHVLHRCHRGEAGCINIRHLYLGDNDQKVRDMVTAGRRGKSDRRRPASCCPGHLPRRRSASGRRPP